MLSLIVPKHVKYKDHIVKKSMLLGISMLASTGVMAKNMVDVYGVPKKTADAIVKKYGKQISSISNEYMQEFKKILLGVEHQSKRDFVIEKQRLVDQIKKENGFLFVDFGLVYYPHHINQYTTLEIIDKNSKERLRFVDAPGTYDQSLPTTKKSKDIIDEMIAYKAVGDHLMFDKDFVVKDFDCPFYHCLYGFNDKRLKPYFSKLNRAEQDKKLIVDTVNNSKNLMRQEAATFLVGYFHDPHEIIKILLPHIKEHQSQIRNNSMRVIWSTLYKSKITTIDLKPFLEALDSPYESDRNKALSVISVAVEGEASKKFMLQHGIDKLLANLRLVQPNNHELAYLILKKISGKDFGDSHMKAWQQWASSLQA